MNQFQSCAICIHNEEWRCTCATSDYYGDRVSYHTCSQHCEIEMDDVGLISDRNGALSSVRYHFNWVQKLRDEERGIYRQCEWYERDLLGIGDIKFWQRPGVEAYLKYRHARKELKKIAEARAQIKAAAALKAEQEAEEARWTRRIARWPRKLAGVLIELTAAAAVMFIYLAGLVYLVKALR